MPELDRSSSALRCGPPLAKEGGMSDRPAFYESHAEQQRNSQRRLTIGPQPRVLSVFTENQKYSGAALTVLLHRSCVVRRSRSAAGGMELGGAAAQRPTRTCERCEVPCDLFIQEWQERPEADSYATKEADVRGPIDRVSDSNGAGEGEQWDWIGLESWDEGLRGTSESRDEGGEADVRFEAARPTVGTEGWLGAGLVDGGVDLTKVPRRGPGDEQGDAVVEHGRANARAQGNGEEASDRGWFFGRDQVKCGGVSIREDHEREKALRHCGGKKLSKGDAAEAGDVDRGRDGFVGWIVEARCTEADVIEARNDGGLSSCDALLIEAMKPGHSQADCC